MKTIFSVQISETSCGAITPAHQIFRTLSNATLQLLFDYGVKTNNRCCADVFQFKYSNDFSKFIAYFVKYFHRKVAGTFNGILNTFFLCNFSVTNIIYLFEKIGWKNIIAYYNIVFQSSRYSV